MTDFCNGFDGDITIPGMPETVKGNRENFVLKNKSDSDYGGNVCCIAAFYTIWLSSMHKPDSSREVRFEFGTCTHLTGPKMEFFRISSDAGRK